MSIKDIIKAEGNKTVEALKPSVESFKESIESMNSGLETVTDSKVEKEFGSFIYKALGNVNGSINTQKIESNAKSSYYYSSEKGITSVAVGRKFGFGLRGKSNNFYLDEKDLLPGLTGMHVDLIKREKQRVLARDFYAFKCAYYHRYQSLYNEFNSKVIDVSIPIKVAKLYSISATGDDSFKIQVLDSVTEGKITQLRFEMPEARWIDDKNIQDKTVYSKNPLSYNYGLRTNKSVNITLTGKYGNKDIKENLSLYLLSVNKDVSYIDNWFNDYYGYGNKIMNMADVIKSIPIQELIRAHMDYNKGVAKTFEYLRLKYAKNLILNGMF